MSATSLKVKRSTVSDMSMGGDGLTMLLGLIFVLMILLQLIGFGGLRDWLEAIGFTSASTWAAIIIIVEAIGALSFFKVVLPPVGKMASMGAAVVTAGFWFVENVRLVSDGVASNLTSSGFFGKYLQQTPGWWTIIEVSIFLFWVLSALGMNKES